MINRFRTLTFISLAIFLLNTAQASTELKGNFTGTVRLGPDMGAVWQGLLTLSVAADGTLAGTLEQPTGETIIVSGTAIGQSITLIFDLGDGNYVIGTGGLNRNIHDHPTIMGGTLSGPNEGDIGDWGYGIGG